MKDVEEFLASRGYLQQTQIGYRDILTRFDNYLSDQKIESMTATPLDILHFLDTRPWGAAARSKAVWCIRAYYRWKYGDDHPVLTLKIRKPPITPHRTLNQKQLDNLAESINIDKPNGLRNLAMIMLMLDTGLRRAEICRLKLADIDLEEKRLVVLVKGGNPGKAVFSVETANSIEDWLSIRDDYALTGTKTLFCSVSGESKGAPISWNGLGTIFRLLSHDAGFDMSPHDFRRTFATQLSRNGAPTEVVRRAGRWTNTAQLQVYTQALQAEDVAPWFFSYRMLEATEDNHK